MIGKLLNKTKFLFFLALFVIPTFNCVADTPIKKNHTDFSSVELFGLKLGQSVQETKNYLIGAFNLNEEQIKEGRFYAPKIEGLDVDALTIKNVQLPLKLNQTSPPVQLRVKKLEILFTLKTPITKPRTSSSKFIVIWFENTPETQEMITKYAIEKVGPPLIDNDEGYQWCNYLSEDAQSCTTSCNLIAPDRVCPSNVSIGLGEASSNIYSLAIVDWSMDTNARIALDALKN